MMAGITLCVPTVGRVSSEPTGAASSVADLDSTTTFGRAVAGSAVSLRRVRDVSLFVGLAALMAFMVWVIYQDLTRIPTIERFMFWR